VGPADARRVATNHLVHGQPAEEHDDQRRARHGEQRRGANRFPNVIGRRVLRTAESWLLQVPVFKTIYGPVRQLVTAFSPGNEAGFKRVVLVEDARRGLVMGFVTREFTLDRGRGPEKLVAVYVPTNHLYLGDVVVVPPSMVFYPDVSVEEGIRIFLTGGMALPDRMQELTRTGEHADET